MYVFCGVPLKRKELHLLYPTSLCESFRNVKIYFRIFMKLSCFIVIHFGSRVEAMDCFCFSVHLYLFSFFTPYYSFCLLKHVTVTLALCAAYNSLSCLCSLSLCISVSIFLHPPDFQRLPQSDRVSQGLNGDLYFSNVITEDSRNDYICYARFPHTQTIQQKQPISVRVLNSESLMSAAYICRREAGGSFLQ